METLGWAYILGKMAISDEELYDVDQKTMHETNFIVWVYKVALYSILNVLLIILKALKKIPFAFFVTMMMQFKLLPVLIHGFFLWNFEVVLTPMMMKNMEIITNQELHEAEKKRRQGNKIKILNVRRYQKRQSLNPFAKFKDARLLLRSGRANINDRVLQEEVEKFIQMQLDNDISLDANLEKKLSTFWFEADLERYQLMTNTISAIFEAMPMAILIFINNEVYFPD